MAARKTKLKIDDNWREKIKAGVVFDRLKKHHLGEIDMSPTQVKAGEIILSRLVPTLSAVEQTVVNETDSLSEQQLNDRLLALFVSRPDLLVTALTMLKAAGHDVPNLTKVGDAAAHTEAVPS